MSHLSFIYRNLETEAGSEIKGLVTFNDFRDFSQGYHWKCEVPGNPAFFEAFKEIGPHWW